MRKQLSSSASEKLGNHPNIHSASLIDRLPHLLLTKDPERLRVVYRPTLASPPPVLDRLQIGRYLDYCSELLSLCGKVAAVYAQALVSSFLP